MESSIFGFIRKYSGRQQLIILALAIALLPLNYVTLELPKTIVNRALGEQMSPEFFGSTFERLELLWILCGLFLIAVIAAGGLKYVLNVYAGIVAERMLRRLRYQLYTQVLRFPLPHFRRVTSGELVQMINAETEALGGFVGEAVSTPAVQGGVLVTSLFFIFVQSPVLGLAGLALYPIQIYVIPKLQAQVNRLGKQRVLQVRRNAERISETVAGVKDIHAHAGSRLERAKFSQQLGQVFWIRFDIYKKKFLIKFLNNFISQLGPFFFYAIGGYFVLQGSMSLGALVAAVAAQRDIASPWRELLTFYQSLYDVKIKYEQTVSQFGPSGLRNERLLDEDPTQAPDLTGELRAVNLTVTDETGEPLIEHVGFRLDLPAHVALTGPGGGGRDALLLAIAGLIEPSGGRVLIGGHEIHKLPSAVLGRKIAYVPSPSYVFGGTIADNLLYGLKQRMIAEPMAEGDLAAMLARERLEADRSGNSPFLAEADWADLAGLGLSGPGDRLAVMIAALDAVLLTPDVYQLGLRSVLPAGYDDGVVENVLDARRAMQERLAADGQLARLVERFDPDRYNTNATLAQNLLFGTPVGNTFDLEHISRHPYVLATLRATGLEDELKGVGLKLAQTMVELFADLPPDHEYFRQFSFISADDLPDYRALVGRADAGRLSSLSAADQELLLTLPFKLIATRHRLGLVSDALQERVLEARRYFRANLPAELADAIDFFEPDRFNRASTVQENILFGRIAYGQAQAAPRIGALVDSVVTELGLRDAVTEVGLGFECGVGGGRLAPAQRQKIALARAILKRPDIMILDDATALLEPSEQPKVRDNILAALEGRTVIWALQQPDWVQHFGRVLVLDQGRVTVDGEAEPEAGPQERAPGTGEQPEDAPRPAPVDG